MELWTVADAGVGVVVLPVVELWMVVDVRVGVVVLTCCGTLDSSGCQSGCCCTHLSWNSGR